MDFNTWRQTRVHNNGAAPSNSTNIMNDTPNNNINAKVESYSHLTSDEMMNALYRTVRDEKSKGVFDINNIWAFYRNISPMLDMESRTKLRGIIDAIDRK